MRYLALVSGGKDSIYSIKCLEQEGHRVVCLLYMKSSQEYSDSYMYQTVGSEVAEMFGECMGVPIFVHETECRSINQQLEYVRSEGDEVEDLYLAVSNALERISFEAVSSGAILSQYQKNRIESVCKRLSLCSLSPLWQMDQKVLLERMIEEGIEARIVKVASSSLGKHCVGMNLKQILECMSDELHITETNYCGEGGEYESVVLDCPMFIKRILIHDYEVCEHPDEVGRNGCVFYMKINRYELNSK
ncbi:putative PP-loop ATPase [Ordospora colligata]|uniref:Diphthine--ammonia ligase n=1 Tax=Ordospora colligata OC4 TaxID=1354746 RepID=A0A0B2UJQ3_9MICR|nr:putative PP-loop ATPase [Ordospora colligata OC4]KHN69247.1 putative PP-loop ATPase [Ordospora colligata OC4]TBU14525.1 putative PP-loop ATPase [Ordospora colligata]TBU14702.1 putative PP-loop ATPase [Ordospora colligata]TBU18087.1 putative PP-loop ATPase [Ordospora colligata]